MILTCVLANLGDLSLLYSPGCSSRSHCYQQRLGKCKKQFQWKNNIGFYLCKSKLLQPGLNILQHAVVLNIIDRNSGYIVKLINNSIFSSGFNLGFSALDRPEMYYFHLTLVAIFIGKNRGNLLKLMDYSVFFKCFYLYFSKLERPEWQFRLFLLVLTWGFAN